MAEEHSPEEPKSKDAAHKKSASIHKLRQIKANISENENLYKLLIDSVSDYAIFFLDPAGYIQSWNAGAQRFKGYTSEEAIGKHFSIFYTPEDIQKNHPAHELEVANAVGKFEEEGWRIRKDGTRFWANVVITRLTSSDGKLLGFAKITRDLTQRKITDENLRLSEERFRLLVSAVKDYAIFMLDPGGRVATWNEGAQRLKGYFPHEIIGQHFSKFYPPEDIRSQKPEWELQEATLTGRFEDEGWRIRKDGTRFWANVVITAVRNERGELIGFSKVTRDTTEHRRLEEKLRRSNEELEQRVQERTTQLEKAIRARDEFMGIVSHELRTPVTSLKLQVQTALKQLNRSESQNFIEKVTKFAFGASRQLDRLAKLIDDMLDVSRISMNKMTMNVAPIELYTFVSELMEQFEEQCKASHCQVILKGRDPIIIKGDLLRLEQLFTNLLINALKYGKEKPITISISKSESKAFISIKDQGIGIAPIDQNRIFERFERAISANEVSGMGIGLFICSKIAEAHMGRIMVQSELGKGSTFTVELPLLEL